MCMRPSVLNASSCAALDCCAHHAIVDWLVDNPSSSQLSTSTLRYSFSHVFLLLRSSPKGSNLIAPIVKIVAFGVVSRVSRSIITSVFMSFCLSSVCVYYNCLSEKSQVLSVKCIFSLFLFPSCNTSLLCQSLFFTWLLVILLIS